MKEPWKYFLLAVVCLVFAELSSSQACAKGAWVQVKTSKEMKTKCSPKDKCSINFSSGSAKFARKFQHHHTGEIGIHISNASWNPPPKVLIPGVTLPIVIRLNMKTTPGKNGGALYLGHVEMGAGAQFWTIEGHKFRGGGSLHHTEIITRVGGQNLLSSNGKSSKWTVPPGRKGVYLYFYFSGGGSGGGGVFNYIYEFKEDYRPQSGSRDKRWGHRLWARLRFDKKQLEINDAVRATVEVRGGESPYWYWWPGKDRTRSPVREMWFATAGLKTVTVEVQDQAGKRAKAQAQIMVLPPPAPLKVKIAPAKRELKPRENILVKAFVKGGRPPYRFVWGHGVQTTGNQVGFKASKMGSQVLSVTVFDKTGKMATAKTQVFVGKVCQVRVASNAPGVRNRKGNLKVEILIGRQLALRVQHKGCKLPFKFLRWSGKPGATGVEWPEVGWGGRNKASVAFASHKLGPKLIYLTAVDADGKKAWNAVTVDVMGAKWKVVNCGPAVVPGLGPRFRCKAQLIQSRFLGRYAKYRNRRFTIRWEPHPDLDFRWDMSTGGAGSFTSLPRHEHKNVTGFSQTHVIANSPDNYRIWVEALIKDGPKLVTVGRSPQLNVFVP